MTASDLDRRKGRSDPERLEHLSYAIHGLNDSVVITDLAGTVLEANAESLRLYGTDDESDIVGKSGLDFVLPEDRERVFADMQAVQTDGVARSEYRVRRKDGSIITVETSASVMTDVEGHPTAIATISRDVTERRRGIELLRMSEEGYRQLFEDNPHPMWVHDPETLRFLAVNDAAVRSYGYSRDEFLSMTIADIRPPEDLPTLLENLAGEAAAPEAGEWRHRRKDGTVIEVEVASHGLTFADRPARLVMVTDITERRQTEEALRRSQERYRELVENALDLIYTHDLAGAITSVNRAVEQVLGYTREEAIGKSIAEVLTPESLARARRLMAEPATGDVPRTHEFEVVAKDGRIVSLEVRPQFIMEDGRPVGVQGIARDVTDRKRATEALQRLAAIVESSTDAIIGVSLEGTITSWNVGAEGIYGYTAEEIVGQPVTVLVPPERLEEYRRNMDRIRAGRMVETAETVRLRKDGNRIDVSLTVSPVLDETGAVVGGSAIARDITESRRAEHELKQAFEMLRRTDDERRRLLARLVEAQEDERRRIAEDIHDDSIQVMAAVAMRLSMLRRQLQEDRHLEMLDGLEQTVEQTISRLRNLLFELRPVALDRDGLASALRMYLEAMRGEADVGVRLDNRLEEEPPVAVRTTLYRICQEALVNVRKHAVAQNVEVVLEERDGGVLVRVADDGKGFDLGGDDRSGAGHLGLSSMRDRAEMAGGWFRIDSRKGGGTTVEFWAPSTGEGPTAG